MGNTFILPQQVGMRPFIKMSEYFDDSRYNALLPELLGGRRKFVHSSGADSNACIGK
jgi:hypothetical protein